MKARQMVSVALKLMGVFLLLKLTQFLGIYAGAFLAFYTGDAVEDVTRTTQVFAAVEGLVPVVVGIALIVGSNAVARWLIPESDDVEMNNGPDADTLLTVALAAIGVFALVKAMPLFASQIVTYRRFKAGGGPTPYGVARGLISSGLQIVIGVALFLQARGVAGLWRKLRS